ncbi:MAG: hypothetical protein GTO02_15350 [Candidatus Dadabacteria bacterium]|nr:hypothetical protein [Candidatus Dadabacteria bacterium]
MNIKARVNKLEKHFKSRKKIKSDSEFEPIGKILKKTPEFLVQYYNYYFHDSSIWHKYDEQQKLDIVKVFNFGENHELPESAIKIKSYFTKIICDILEIDLLEEDEIICQEKLNNLIGSYDKNVIN